ncbi:hypothetical protein K493DRAFT_316348 [Basidiobolus meristosporus CBS 931.73]|uniref:RRM domain-containing protein n=1 Tax=Basidiobolus meristosporus CBS 931.73 TaxID=1314790 RepID=A0A1Y1Y4D3_9FUNG|nr:hypothetical protein K493DRAFT_316348 [Basidiobolus meristosporus CBS 931.73]|eukprot:ORX92848.1 hypothetical protein K493DRAFT_316348 [Basidiobolus meristosporus CBS 931.73]
MSSLEERRLFVGNIPYNVAWQELKDLFRQFGTVIRADIMRTPNGTSKGHGTVVFIKPEEARAALAQLNGFQWHGRFIEVREDRCMLDYPTNSVESSFSMDHSIELDSISNKPPMYHFNPFGISKSRDSLTTNESGSATDVFSSPASLNQYHRPILVRQIFVGNLPFRVQWKEVKDLFRKAGNVLRADLGLTQENRPKGHCTVLFATVEDAQNAVDMFNGYIWYGRTLEVREDRGYVEYRVTPLIGPQKIDNICNELAMINAEERQIFVSNLPFQCRWQNLKDLFRSAGTVLRADIAVAFDGKSRGFGTVLFAAPDDARKAIAMYNGFQINGRTLHVQFHKCSTFPSLPVSQRRPSLTFIQPHQIGSKGNIIAPTNLQHLSPRQISPTSHIVASYSHFMDPALNSPTHSNDSLAFPPLSFDSNISNHMNISRLPLVQGHLHSSIFQDIISSGQNHSPTIAKPHLLSQQPNPIVSGATQVFVRNLPYSIRWQELRRLFSQIGPISRAEIFEMDGKSKGIGTVRYFSALDAHVAVQRLNGFVLAGRSLEVHFDRFAF